MREQAVPEIPAGGAKLAEQAAADVVAVEEEELVQAGTREAADGRVLQARAVQPQAPQALVRRQQRAQHVVRQGHLLQSPKTTGAAIALESYQPRLLRRGSENEDARDGRVRTRRWKEGRKASAWGAHARRPRQAAAARRRERTSRRERMVATTAPGSATSIGGGDGSIGSGTGGGDMAAGDAALVGRWVRVAWEREREVAMFEDQSVQTSASAPLLLRGSFVSERGARPPAWCLLRGLCGLGPMSMVKAHSFYCFCKLG
jgi:hypothetical protein